MTKSYMRFSGVLLFAFVLNSLLTAEVFGQSQIDGDSITGRWMDEKGLSATKIYKDKNTFSGKIIWLKNPYDDNGNDVRDVKNKNETLRNRKLNGLVILKGLKYKGNNTWEDGDIYVPRIGEILKCEAKLLSMDTLEVNVYYGISKVSKKVKWIRH